MSTGKSVVVVGAGTIGSYLVDNLARSTQVASITIIDRDRYEPRNRENQVGAAPGRKAVVQARRVRRFRSSIEVRPITGDIERLPIGECRADLVVSAVDNRRARVHLNQATRWLGVPWIDTGVLADGNHARITRVASDPAAPCYLCGWGPRDFELVERTWSCTGRNGASSDGPASGTTAALGSLAASLAALEAERVLRGDSEPGRAEELVIAANRWEAVTTRRVKDSACRADHSRLAIVTAPAPASWSLGDLIARAASELHPVTSLRVLGARLATEAHCGRCGAVPMAPSVVRRGDTAVRCDRCGRRATVLGFGLRAEIQVGDLERPALDRPLATLGCAVRDLIAVSGGDHTMCYEVSDAN